MNVSAVSWSGVSGVSGGWSGASPVAGGKWDDQYKGALSSVASLMGKPVADLQAAARTRSLSDVASAGGIGQDELEAAIKAGMTGAGSQLSGTRLDNVAHRVAISRQHVGTVSARPATWGATTATDRDA